MFNNGDVLVIGLVYIKKIENSGRFQLLKGRGGVGSWAPN